MQNIHKNADLVLSEGYTEYVIDTDRDLELTILARCNAQAFFRIVNVGKLVIRSFCEEGEVTLLFWNAMDRVLHVNETHDVLRDATLKIAYGELNQAETRRVNRVSLLQEGASAKLSSAALVTDRKFFDMSVVSYAPHTEGIMENYAVVLKGGSYKMDCTGSIVRGAHGSKSHQTSRALCFDEGQNSVILPKLLIDENDVEASHATSVGRVNEDQLYYMQTRGLTTNQCTALISEGYLSPVVNIIDDENLKETLKEELEGKIGELCSM